MGEIHDYSWLYMIGFPIFVGVKHFNLRVISVSLYLCISVVPPWLLILLKSHYSDHQINTYPHNRAGLKTFIKVDRNPQSMKADLSWIYSLKTIAVVGASRDERKPSHYVPKYLEDRGYTIIPVNPSASEILGEKSYKSLKDIPFPVDIVLMFRPSQEIGDFLPDIIKSSPKVLWMQLGIVNHEVKAEAEKHDIYVVMDRCMMVEHKKIFGG